MILQISPLKSSSNRPVGLARYIGKYTNDIKQFYACQFLSMLKTFWTRWSQQANFLCTPPWSHVCTCTLRRGRRGLCCGQTLNFALVAKMRNIRLSVTPLKATHWSQPYSWLCFWMSQETAFACMHSKHGFACKYTVVDCLKIGLFCSYQVENKGIQKVLLAWNSWSQWYNCFQTNIVLDYFA